MFHYAWFMFRVLWFMFHEMRSMYTVRVQSLDFLELRWRESGRLVSESSLICSLKILLPRLGHEDDDLCRRETDGILQHDMILIVFRTEGQVLTASIIAWRAVEDLPIEYLSVFLKSEIWYFASGLEAEFIEWNLSIFSSFSRMFLLILKQSKVYKKSYR